MFQTSGLARQLTDPIDQARHLGQGPRRGRAGGLELTSAIEPLIFFTNVPIPEETQRSQKRAICKKCTDSNFKISRRWSMHTEPHSFQLSYNIGCDK